MAPVGLSVRFVTVDRPREWRRGVLDMETANVAVATETVRPRQVPAIAHVPRCRRDTPPPANPADPFVSVGWWVLAGAILCPIILETSSGRVAGWGSAAAPRVHSVGCTDAVRRGRRTRWSPRARG
jgi:hypothetical protein